MSLPKQKVTYFRIVIVAVLVVSGLLFWHNLQARAQVASIAPSPFRITPAWPEKTAAAAIGVEEYGVVATSGDEKQRPIASIAKVITALTLLEKYPLKPGEQGPLIPITAKDEQLYRDYVAKNGTVVLIKAGTSITLRQALEAMLLPSANNIADSSAAWAFGSLNKYHRQANKMLQQHGLKNTVVGGDASGLDPTTKSTTRDLVKLGKLALDNAVIAEIAAQKSATIPVAGVIPNYNALVTKHGYIGIKPGDSIEAGNTLLYAKQHNINGKKATVVGVILGAENYKSINDSAIKLMDSSLKSIDSSFAKGVSKQ